MKKDFLKKDPLTAVMLVLTFILTINYVINGDFKSVMMLYLLTGVVYLLTKNLLFSLLIGILLVNIFVSGLVTSREGVQGFEKRRKRIQRLMDKLKISREEAKEIMDARGNARHQLPNYVEMAEAQLNRVIAGNDSVPGKSRREEFRDTIEFGEFMEEMVREEKDKADGTALKNQLGQLSDRLTEEIRKAKLKFLNEARITSSWDLAAPTTWEYCAVKKLEFIRDLAKRAPGGVVDDAAVNARISNMKKTAAYIGGKAAKVKCNTESNFK